MTAYDFNDSLYLAAIVESTDDAIISKNLDGIITSWNRAAEKLYGYTAAEAVGQHIRLIIPPDRYDEEYVIMGHVAAGEAVNHFETVRRAKDGTLREISLTISPIKRPDGTVIGASKIARDIGPLKEAERASAYLAAIVDSSDDAILSKNLDGVITSWNRAAERMYGYTADEAVGRPITMLIPQELLDEEYAIIGRIKNGQRVDHIETVRQRKDGSRFDVSLTVSPIYDRAGRIIGASKIARDITQQKATEKALRESAQRKDEFLANISHEMRTPMNAVIGLASLLERVDTLTERQQNYIKTLRHSADSLMTLINNLLDISRIETGVVELESAEFDLPATIEMVADLVRLKAKAKNLPLRVSYGNGLNQYYIGDAFRLRQILTNLLDNAVKFTERGAIDLTAEAETADGQTTLVLTVADTGIGIPADKLDAVFEKFTQADASTSRRFGGSGLGLSICRSLVEQMGGTVTVRSRVELGTTFTVRIPVADSERAAPVGAAAAPGKGAHKNILIVEDYEANSMVIAGLVELFGYNYDIATNGLEAIHNTRDCTYDVILMDIQMPGMDGLESARRIRAQTAEKGAADPVIIAMTAHVRDEDKQQCFDAGMDDFLPKPFDLAILEDKLKQYIKAR